jgi:hypothetical protein
MITLAPWQARKAFRASCYSGVTAVVTAAKLMGLATLFFFWMTSRSVSFICGLEGSVCGYEFLAKVIL